MSDFLDDLVDAGEFTLDTDPVDDGDDVLVVPQCLDCVRLKPTMQCAAFPEGIPEPILFNRHDHREPYPGDHGLRFQAKAES